MEPQIYSEEDRKYLEGIENDRRRIKPLTIAMGIASAANIGILLKDYIGLSRIDVYISPMLSFPIAALFSVGLLSLRSIGRDHDKITRKYRKDI